MKIRLFGKRKEKTGPDASENAELGTETGGSGKPKNSFFKKMIKPVAIMACVGVVGTGLYFGGRETVKFVKKVNTTCDKVEKIEGTVNTINTNAANAAAGIANANTKLGTIELKLNDVGEGVAYMIINGVKIQLTQEQVQKLHIDVKVSDITKSKKKPSWLRKMGHALGLVKNLNLEEKEMKVDNVNTTVVESTNNTTTTLGPVKLPKIAQPQPKLKSIELQKPKD